LNIGGSVNITGGSARTEIDNTTATASFASASASTALTRVPNEFGEIVFNPPPAGQGLFLTSENLGYYDTNGWKTYMANNGDFFLTGSNNNSLRWISQTGTLNISGVVNITGGDTFNELQNLSSSLQEVSASAGESIVDEFGKIDFNPPPSTGQGLFLTSQNLGYYDGGEWKTYMSSSGDFFLAGTTSEGLLWNSSESELSIDGNITARSGSIEGPLGMGASGKISIDDKLLISLNEIAPTPTYVTNNFMNSSNSTNIIDTQSPVQIFSGVLGATPFQKVALSNIVAIKFRIEAAADSPTLGQFVSGTNINVNVKLQGDTIAAAGNVFNNKYVTLREQTYNIVGPVVNNDLGLSNIIFRTGTQSGRYGRFRLIFDITGTFATADVGQGTRQDKLRITGTTVAGVSGSFIEQTTPISIRSNGIFTRVLTDEINLLDFE